jgi:hypothetical protein
MENEGGGAADLLIESPGARRLFGKNAKWPFELVGVEGVD